MRIGSEEYKMPNYCLHVCKKIISCLKERTIIAIWYTIHTLYHGRGILFFSISRRVYDCIRLGIRTYVTTRGKGDRN